MIDFCTPVQTLIRARDSHRKFRHSDQPTFTALPTDDLGLVTKC